MVDQMLRALRAHVKEPEPIDWEKRYAALCSEHDALQEAYLCVDLDLAEKEIEMDSLKAQITRLEQRCAELEGNKGNVVAEKVWWDSEKEVLVRSPITAQEMYRTDLGE